MSDLKKTSKKTTPQAPKKNVLQKKKTNLSKPDNDILMLQKRVGNQAVQRLVNSRIIQAKLTVGQPNDKYEQEADRVADEVMRMPEAKVQRQVEDEEEELVQTKPMGEQITPLVQRQPEEEEEELLQTKSKGEPAQLTPHLESNINALEGTGQPLSEETRNFFEPRFGQDFSKVRVHHDSNANQLARSVNARAFTKGNNVVFGAGEYSPESSSGKRLLGHELVHVGQQKQVTSSHQKKTIRRQKKKSPIEKKLEKDEKIFKQVVLSLKPKKPKSNNEKFKKSIDSLLGTVGKDKVSNKLLKQLKLKPKYFPLLKFIGLGGYSIFQLNKKKVPNLSIDFKVKPNLILNIKTKGDFKNPKVMLNLKWRF